MKKREILYLGNKLSQKGGNITTIETLSSKLEDAGFVIRSASNKRNKFLRMIDMLWTTLNRAKRVNFVLIDTYSTQNFWYARMVAKVCRLKKAPYIPILHGGDLPRRLNSDKKASEKLFGLAYTNVAPSKYILKAFKNEGFNNLTYIPNTIELSNYPFTLRSEIAPKLLWVRSFAEIYNPILALKSLESLTQKFPKVSLCMVGPDKDGSMKQCKEYAERNNLKVKFTGMLSKDEWIALSKDYDIFINTTNFDNMPVSVLEAMALGMPVISTGVGGIPYLIEDGDNGLLVAPNNAAKFAEAIEKLINDNRLAIGLSERGRKYVEEFDWSVVQQKWMELLNK